MDHPAGKKLFTAEKQRMKAQGPAYVSPGAGADSNVILAAIAALQGEVRALDTYVRTQQGSGTASESEPSWDDAISESKGELGAEDEVKLLRNEIRAMSLAIQQTKSEIAALRPHNSEDDRLMVVTQELDAIVTATEGATNTILEAAEKVDALAEQIEGMGSDSASHQAASDIRDTVVNMFEACNFQDITGQRISKVVKTLQFIEERVNKMIEIWGAEGFADVGHNQEEIDEEAALLNGPQLANQGVSQADIDKLFD
jgi:chemotaxis protein CheZ